MAEQGAPILELVYLEELARDGVYEFAFLGGSLKLRGADAAPIRPIAIPLGPVSTVETEQVKTAINPVHLPNTTQYGYSQATVAASDATLIHVAGQIGISEEGPNDFRHQVDRSFDALIAVLQAAGAQVEDVVKITLLIRDHDDEKLQYLVRKRREVFGDNPPASTLIPVTALALGWSGHRSRVLPVPLVNNLSTVREVGSKLDELHFTGIDLGTLPTVVQRYVRADASQGELRSHGFFYRRDGDESGVFGLPVRSEGAPGYAHLFAGSASVLFIQNGDRSFSELGGLVASETTTDSDGCIASCIDWYGNARPLFFRGRVFALLGYELVEGTVGDTAIREVRRVSFAPRVSRAGSN